MALAAYGGLEAMNSAETKPKEWGLGKPCAGKPLARFDEGEGRADGLPTRGSLYSTHFCGLGCLRLSRDWVKSVLHGMLWVAAEGS